MFNAHVDDALRGDSPDKHQANDGPMFVTAHGHVTAMRGHDLAAQRQADPVAVTFGGQKWHEDLAEHVIRNARPVSGDLQQYASVIETR